MSLPELPDGDQPATVLLLAPGFGDAGTAGCSGLFANSGAENLLYVTWSGDPSDRLAHAREHVDDVERARAVVVGDLSGPPSGPFDAVETVNAPTDLTGVGIAVTELLSQTEGSTAVCFDSVTALLQYVDLDTAFEFLHVFAGRLHRYDAVGHFHMDPGAHDPQVVAQVASLLDGKLVLDDDGDVEDAAASLRDWNR
ncbi:hypothetical protein L593_12685 [Salinarchaeum sp. Harcht-Bsk1]|uniref:DUF7504 family protein n=1 Tax=Salinarchaeum sp. Harcht-Bsk1 TaxID=1333523 RepID=UPI00034231A4|nr:hypothetical protein [Salinarchaeum sp. Harcht-Bsk1]AGN02476.1 hypothetical protein L593_12685 [Salinarchaeum sp. Harcht-Bsk1]